MLVVSTYSGKGGVGKTSITTGMAAAAAARGLDVVVVDGDPRATATIELGIESTADRLTLNDLLYVSHDREDPPDPADVIRDVMLPAGKDWPPNVRLIAAERNLANRETDPAPIEHRLRRGLAGLDPASVDLVLCDLPPRPGGKIVNTILIATDVVLIPSTLQTDGYEGVRDAKRSLTLIQQGPNPALRQLGIVRSIVPRRPDRRKIHDQIDRLLSETWPTEVLGVNIYEYSIREETRFASVPITSAPGKEARILDAAYAVLIDHLMEVKVAA